MELALIVLSVAFGGAAGLLVPRPAYRLAVEASQRWRSHCPRGHAITGWGNGWVGLGRCTATGSPVDDGGKQPKGSPCRYGRRLVVAPAISALACALLTAVVGMRPESVVCMMVTPFGVLLGLIDAAVHRLPDVLTLPVAGGTVALLGIVALLPGHHGSWATAAGGSIVLAALYFVMFLINPSGMGLGDVKLALSVGALLGWYGWPTLFLGTLVAFCLAALYGVGLMILRRATRRSAIAFGPFMLLGALAGVAFGAWTT